jgi:hypothetical protein
MNKLAYYYPGLLDYTLAGAGGTAAGLATDYALGTHSPVIAGTTGAALGTGTVALAEALSRLITELPEEQSLSHFQKAMALRRASENADANRSMVSPFQVYGDPRWQAALGR